MQVENIIEIMTRTYRLSAQDGCKQSVSECLKGAVCEDSSGSKVRIQILFYLYAFILTTIIMFVARCFTDELQR